MREEITLYSFVKFQITNCLSFIKYKGKTNDNENVYGQLIDTVIPWGFSFHIIIRSCRQLYCGFSKSSVVVRAGRYIDASSFKFKF